jgi:hypothetical protein
MGTNNGTRTKSGDGPRSPRSPDTARGGATGYARYALAYPADPTCIRVYVLYLKKTKTKEHLPVS